MDEKKRYAVVDASDWVSYAVGTLEVARDVAAGWEKSDPGQNPHRVVELVPVPDPLPTVLGSVVRVGGNKYVLRLDARGRDSWQRVSALDLTDEATLRARGPVTVLFDAATAGGDSDE